MEFQEIAKLIITDSFELFGQNRLNQEINVFLFKPEETKLRNLIYEIGIVINSNTFPGAKAIKEAGFRVFPVTKRIAFNIAGNDFKFEHCLNVFLNVVFPCKNDFFMNIFKDKELDLLYTSHTSHTGCPALKELLPKFKKVTMI